MLMGILILSALGAAAGLGCLVLLARQAGEKRAEHRPAVGEDGGEEEQASGEARLQEGIANLLSYGIDGKGEKG